MKRLFIISVFVISIGSHINGQAISFAGGASFISPKYLTFQYFIDSYNLYHKEYLQSKLNYLPTSVGEYLNASFHGNHLTVDLGYQAFNMSSNAIFINGDSRNFDFRVRTMDLLMGGGFSKKNLGIWAFGGLYFGLMKMDSYYKYNDGTVSFGLDKFLNGQFSNGMSGYTLGIKSSIPVYKYISILLKVEKVTAFRGSLRYNALEDRNTSRQALGAYIPTDFYHYKDIITSNSYLPEEYQTRTDLEGFKYTIGLQIDIFK